jgi:ribosomal protein S18 acetylase RimI-like enzyme
VDTHLLDHITWHSLSGPHAHWSTGTDAARRYAPGFSPLLGFADVLHPDFAALESFCSPKESFYCDGWSGITPQGWCIDSESTMYKMLWHGTPPTHDEARDAIRLGNEHVTQALALTALTKPGPFGPRTLELGEYFGYFDGTQLVAMAGERMYAGRFREISGVCTHPDFQGAGLARRLMRKLIYRQLQRQEIPFLHVMRHNTSAHNLYTRLGFHNYLESVIRVVSRR